MRKQGVIRPPVEVEVPFHDVDLAGVVWHGHYMKYLENARWAVMNRIGFGLDAMMASGYLWPVVGLQVKYVRAARYGDRLHVRASMVEWESRAGARTICCWTTDNTAPRRASADRAGRGRGATPGTLQLVSPACLTGSRAGSAE